MNVICCINHVVTVEYCRWSVVTCEMSIDSLTQVNVERCYLSGIFRMGKLSSELYYFVLGTKVQIRWNEVSVSLRSAS